MKPKLSKRVIYSNQESLPEKMLLSFTHSYILGYTSTYNSLQLLCYNELEVLDNLFQFTV